MSDHVQRTANQVWAALTAPQRRSLLRMFNEAIREGWRPDIYASGEPEDLYDITRTLR